MKSSVVLTIFLFMSCEDSSASFSMLNPIGKNMEPEVFQLDTCRIYIPDCTGEFSRKEGIRVEASLQSDCGMNGHEWMFTLSFPNGTQVMKQSRSRRNIFKTPPFYLTEFTLYTLSIEYYGSYADDFSAGDHVTLKKICRYRQKWHKYKFKTDYPYGRLPKESAGPCSGPAYIPFLMTNLNDMFLPQKLTEVKSYVKRRFMAGDFAQGTIRQDGLLIISKSALDSSPCQYPEGSKFEFTIGAEINMDPFDTSPWYPSDNIVVATKQFDNPTAPEQGIIFRCETNCGFGVTSSVNVHKQFILTAFPGPSLKGVWTWSWDNEDVDLKTIRDETTESHVLSIGPNSVPINRLITFEVQLGTGRAKYQISTVQDFKNGHCSVVPEEVDFGTSTTLFCEGFDGVYPLMYEIHTKVRAGYRFLQASQFPQQEFIPISDGVRVEVYDAHDTRGQIELSSPTVKSKPDAETVPISYELTQVEEALRDEAYDNALSLLSSFTMLVYDYGQLNDKLKMAILKLLLKVPSYNDSMLKSAGNIIFHLGNFTNYAKSRTIMCLGIVSRLVTERFERLGSQGGELTDAHPDRTSLFLFTLLSVEEAMKLQDFEALPSNDNPHDRTVNIYQVKRGISEFIKSADYLTFEVAKERIRLRVETKVDFEDISLNIKTDSPLKAFNFTKNLNSRVTFNPSMGNQYSAYDKLAIIETILPKIFWWAPKFAQTECVLLNLFGFYSEASAAVRLERSQIPFRVNLKLNNVSVGRINGSALPESDDPQPVHELLFDRNEGSLLLIFNEDMIAQKLKVVISQNAYPEPSHVRSAQSLNGTKQLFRLNRTEPVPNFVYIAVQATGNETVAYDFQVNHIVCQEWLNEEFDSHYCKELINSTEEFIHCECTHLSEYVARMLFPKHSIILAQDIKLFVEWERSYVMVTVMSSLLFLKLIGLIAACYRDRITMKRSAILILDNDPRDKFPYLIGMLSGRDLSCRNTALIAVRLHGELYNTRVHILNPPELPQTVLKPGSEDWFILFSPKRLGTIKFVEIFTDNEGANPFWFLLTITVVDLNKRKTFAFRYNDWISVQHVPRGETVTRIPNSGLSMPWQVLMAANVQLGFRENHRWLRIILRHPRSTHTRSERISLTYGLLATSLVLTMAFLEIQESGPMDRPNIQVKIEEYITSIECLLIGAFVLLIIGQVFSFAKVSYDYGTKEYYKLKHLEPKYSLKIRDTSETDLSNPRFITVSGDRRDLLVVPLGLVSALALTPGTSLVTLWNILAEGLEKFIFPGRLRPVFVGPPHKYLHEGRWALAWIVSLTYNIAISVTIMIYGMKLGRNQSYMWMLNVFLSVISDVGVFQIIKIILMGFIVAYFFRGQTVHVVKMGAASNWSFPTSKKDRSEFFRDALEERTQDFYKPLPLDYIEENSERMTENSIRNLFVIRTSILVLIIIPSTLLAMLLNVHGDRLTSKLIQENLLERQKKTVECYGLREVQNRTNLLETFIWTIMPSLHVVNWYNNKTLPLGGGEAIRAEQTNEPQSFVRGYVKDYASKMIGVPRIRQQRINAKYEAIVPKEFRGHFNHSYGRISFWNEDRAAYGKKWIQYQGEDFKYLNVWTYTNAYFSKTYRLMGETRTFYSGGGYFINLGANLDKSVEILTDLYMNNWIDFLTRLLAFELNLYAVNSRRYTAIQGVIEVLPSGVLTKKIGVSTYLAPSPERSAGEAICFILILTMIICQVPLCYHNFSRNGFVRYILSVGNIVDFSLVVIGLGFSASFLNKAIFYAVAFSEDVEVHGDEYFSFQTLIENDQSMTATFGFFTCLAVCRLSYILFDAFLWRTQIFSVLRAFVVSFLSIAAVFIVTGHTLFVSLFVCTKGIHAVVLPFVSVKQAQYEGGCENEIISVLTLLWFTSRLIISAAFIYSSLESVFNIYESAEAVGPVQYVRVRASSSEESSRDSSSEERLPLKGISRRGGGRSRYSVVKDRHFKRKASVEKKMMLFGPKIP